MNSDLYSDINCSNKSSNSPCSSSSGSRTILLESISVVEQAENFQEFKKQILTSIVSISHLDVRHKKFYDERKKLVKDFPEEDIALFISENEIDYNESIYNYTDNTIEERKAIIDYVSRHGIPSNIGEIYPALENYLRQ